MNFKDIQSLIKGFEQSNLTHLELETEAIKLKLNKEVTVNKATVVEHIVPLQETKKNEEAPVIKKGEAVRSPLVGTFYSAPSPQDAPFVSVGQKVQAGDTVCIIEAMKIMNEITAPTSGTIETIDVKNGDVVSFDQVLFTIV